MKRRLIGILAAAAACLVAPARAQEACKAVTLKKAAVPLAEVYAMADKLAKAWKADAIPERGTAWVDERFYTQLGLARRLRPT